MRIESSVTAISWIPSEAITSAALKAPFEIGVSHYDEPLPDHIDNLAAMRDADNAAARRWSPASRRRRRQTSRPATPR